MVHHVLPLKKWSNALEKNTKMDVDILTIWSKTLYPYYSISFAQLPMSGIVKRVEKSENNIAVVIKPGIYVE